MKAHRLAAAAAGAAAVLVVLAILAWQARPLEPAAHRRVMDNLSKLQELDAELDATVLKLRDGLLGSYDPLVATMGLVHAHRHDLEQVKDAITQVGGVRLAVEITGVAARIAEKQALLEQFKSRNAQLRSSFHYFPLSVDKVALDPRVPEAPRADAQRLLRDVLLLRLGATSTDYELVALQISQLGRHRVPAATRQNLELMLDHADKVLHHQATLDRLVQDISAAGFTRASGALAGAYNGAFERKLREAYVYRFVLLLVSATLLGCAGFAFLRLRRNAAELERSEARYRKLFDLSPDGMLISAEGRIALVNGTCLKLFGAASPDELVGRPALELFHADQRGRAAEHMRRTAEQTRLAPPEELTLLKLDGTTLEVDVAASPFVHAGRPSVQIVLRDITERKKASERLNYLAQYDSLTGLPNRGLFRDRLEHGLAQASRSRQPGALLYIDIDRFKSVNDTLGHAIGDRLLQQVAARLKECVRGGDTVGRFGGDEFGIILLDLAKPADAGLVAQKINDALGRPFDLGGHRPFVTGSVGIALYPADGTDPETLSKNADAAMYRAKEKGRNNYQFFTPEMNERVVQRMDMEASMRRALERAEFRLHYQPKVELARGTICGVEALLRWTHPTRGPISPTEFVPVLEDTGLILPVGEWVTREACRQIAAWQAAGVKVPPVSVNLSVRQFHDRALAQTLPEIIRQSGVDPSLLQFEITESLLMNDPHSAERILSGLKAAGVKLSIDDFGTGYSSLAYLRRFPLDVLKIDRAFIKDIVANPDDAAITLAVIGLAHSLSLKVVAEGVEAEAQVNLLALHACDEIQGEYFSPAVPPAQLEAMLRADRRLVRSQNWTHAKPAVLLVDDDEDYLRLLARLLRSESFSVLTANSAAEGFAVLASHRVGVVISDQCMPGMDGAQFLRKLGKLYPQALRVAITGVQDQDILALAVNEAGIHKFLSKHWDEKRLRREVRDVYERALGNSATT